MKIIITSFIVFMLVCSVIAIYQSSVQARVYNEQYGTHFTTSDFFWASDQINSNSQTIKLK